jgi:hypothetical protein
MEHIIRSGKYFLIRTKDIHSSSSLLRKFNLPDSEFDLDIKTTLTTKQTSDVRLHPEKYRFLSNTSTFDFFEACYMQAEIHQILQSEFTSLCNEDITSFFAFGC